MKNSFAFYYSWWEAIKNLPRDVQGDVLTAIVEYGLTGVTTEQLKPITKAMLTMVKTQIDIDNKRFENGKKGGRKKTTLNQTQTKHEPNTNQIRTKPEPNSNQNQTKLEPNLNQGCGLVSGEKENEKDVSDGFSLQPFSLTSEKEKEKEIKENTPYGVLKKNEKSGLEILEIPSPPGSAPPPSPKSSVFIKPTIEEVKTYFEEKGLKSDPEHFYDHFESNGWKVSGRSTMKDWKAAARNWERNDSRFKKRDYAGNTKPVYGNKAPEEFGKGYWSDDI